MTEDKFLNVKHEYYDWSTQNKSWVPADGTIWWYAEGNYRFSLVGNGVDDVETLRTEQVKTDAGWTTATSLENGWRGIVSYIIRSGTVTINVTDLNSSEATSDVVLSLGARYSPDVTIRLLLGSAAQPAIIYQAYITTSGQITLNRSIADMLRGDRS